MSTRTTWNRYGVFLSCCLGLCLSLVSCDVQEPCGNAVQDGDETDVDCGGSCEARCQPGLLCQQSSDCASHVCVNNQCAAPTCEDKRENGEETDVDCGGNSGCALCDDYRGCSSDSDCKSSGCVQGICAPSLVREVSPVRGERTGGTVVTLRGPGLTSKSVSDVLFGGQAATGLSQGQDGVVQVTTPSRDKAGLVDVTVVFSDGSKSTLAAGFRYFYGQLKFSSAYTFEAESFSPRCRAVGTADLNADGKSDLVMFCYDTEPIEYGNALHSYLSRGDGTFTWWQSVRNIRGRADRMVILDYNKDGKPDVAAVYWDQDILDIFTGTVKSDFIVPSVEKYVGPGAYPLAAGDFDSDGFTDLMVFTQNTAQRCLFRNQKGMGFDQGICTPSSAIPAFDLAVGDFDLNGGLDTALGNRFLNAGTIIASLNNYNGLFTRDIFMSSRDVYDSMSAFDVNEDGIVDLVSVGYDPYNVDVRFGRGDGTFENPKRAYTYPNYQGWGKAIADYDGDGRLDLATTSDARRSPNSVLLNKTGDGTFTLGADLPGDFVANVASGDFDGDGRIDLVYTSWGTKEVYVFLNRSE